MSELRTLSGEPPLGIGGLAFRDDQGEWLEHDNPRYRSAATRIGVLALNGGTFLAHPPGFRVDGRQHATREAALRAGIAAMIRKARKYMRAKDGEGTRWTEGYGGRVIDWALSLKPPKPQIVRSPYRVAVQFSGGAASYVAAKLILEEYGHDGVALVFADTLIEDEDLYRFLEDAEQKLMHPIIRISEGRDPWTVFFDERMMGNSRVDPCSKILKRKLLDKWRAQNCASDCVVVIGYDASEDFRLQPLRARMAPLHVRAPLLEKGIFKEQAYARVEADGLRLPRLYGMGFPHNNCGGFCVKAGQASFALLLEHMPERYAQHEAKEEEFRKFIGKDVSIMRDRRGGESKPLTMRAFRERHQADPSIVDRSELGGCTCMDEPGDEVGVTDDPPGNLPGALNQQTYAAIDAGVSISDPVVAALVEAHGLRKQFPAAHIFSMTTAVDDGRIVSVATCSCGHALRFGSNDYVRMNAAIEAHWRRHPDGPMVDGRGEPIKPGDGARIAGSKARKRKPAKTNSETQSADEHNPVAQSGAGQGDASSASEAHLADQLAPVDPAADEGARGDDPSQAPPAVHSEAAPIGAGETQWSSLLEAAAALAWDDKQAYQGFLATKARDDAPTGFDVDPDALNLALKPFQRDIVRWALRRGRAALFAGTGLGKTLQQLAWADEVERRFGPVLILTPLAVAQQTCGEAEKFGIPGVAYARDAEAISSRIVVTNYDRLDKFDPARFAGVVLDESSILKSFDGRTRMQLTEAFARTRLKLACTATPAPNDYTELGTHSEFLGVLQQKEMLATWFVHDGGSRATSMENHGQRQGSDWRLKGHAHDAFWRWLASWSVMIRHPRDLGYEDAGYDLPPLNRHQVLIKTASEGDLLGKVALARTLQERLAARRDTIDARVAAAATIVNAGPDRQWLVWCNLNDESSALAAAIPGAVEVRGSDDPDEKAARLLGFARGEVRVMVSKPSIAGWGMNFQRCADMVFVGLNDSFEQLYQAVRRCWRFGQTREVNVHLIAADIEGEVVANLEAKEEQADYMAEAMVGHMRGLSIANLQAARTVSIHDKPMQLPTWLKCS